MHDPNADVKAQFKQVFSQGVTDSSSAETGMKIHVVRAPGRVNLIGEHTDYNDGFVCPMAIEPEVKIVCRTRNDDRVRLASTAFPGQIVEFSVNKKIERGEPKWANYSKGVAAELVAAGIPLTGVDALISNTLPIGGGLSSSAALEVGTAIAFLSVAGLKMDLTRLTLLCQKAEHDFAGVPVGIMDMTAVAFGKAGHAILLDCRDLSKQFVAIDANELRVVIVNTMVKHELSGGEYARRRKQCEQGVAYFQKQYPEQNIKALRDVMMKQLDAAKGVLDDIVFRRCRHVIGENHRTTEAAAMLNQRKYEDAGELMIQSHNSLRDDYEVSCAELDFLAAESMKVKGVYGARMTGGGFGGCIVAITQPRAVEPLIAHLTKTYQEKFNITPAAYITTATDGAQLIA